MAQAEGLSLHSMRTYMYEGLHVDGYIDDVVCTRAYMFEGLQALPMKDNVFARASTHR